MSHTIYLCDIKFSKRPASGAEKELRNKSEAYRDRVEKRRKIIGTKFSGVSHNNFIGMVEYIPTEPGGHIKDSADILVYLYKNKSIISTAYKSCISSIISFINNNNIKTLSLSGDDVERLKINGIDIINDIKIGTQNINKDLVLVPTEQKQSIKGYHLI